MTLLWQLQISGVADMLSFGPGDLVQTLLETCTYGNVGSA